ncbi:Flp pilus assembly complex ATPase component TadA [Candidatus Micrarchaeota archaeon]|nr:Flp pilus assembly complex ATPase component TadA [Candidatus Micrarchaeota archaeon]
MDWGWQITTQADATYTLDSRWILNPTERFIYETLYSQLKNKKDISLNELPEHLFRLCERRNHALKSDRARTIIQLVQMNVEGFGILDPLLHDDRIEEIAVWTTNEPIRVYLREKGWQKTNAVFTSNESLISLINKMARPLGRRLSYQTPRINAFLPNGNRLHAAIPPVTLNGTTLTIRRFRESPWSITDLVRNGTISADAAACVWMACLTDTNILIAGNTGSGKTSFLNALFAFVPIQERIVLVEETPEIRIPQTHCVRLMAHTGWGITMSSLVLDTLRMRPDRLVIGESRSEEEVRALFDALSSGQAKGTFATYHARTASEALHRLKAQGIRDYEMSALDLIVVLRRYDFFKGHQSTERRKVMEIACIENGECKTLKTVNDPYRLGTSSAFGKKMVNAFGGLSAHQKQWRRRSQFIKALADRRADPTETTHALQSFR